MSGKPQVESMMRRDDGSEPLVMVTVRMTKDERNQLTNLAKREGVSVNKFCIQRLLAP